MSEKVTYESLLKDDDFLTDAYYSLKGMGYDVTDNRKDVLDKFLQTRRYFDVNIASTITQGGDIKDLSDIDKESYKNALNKIEELPNVFQDGSAPRWNAVKDYAIAGITDPTNLLSVLAGAFTLGTGSAAAFGAKEAAKQGLKQTLNAKLRTLTSAPVLKAYAVEGTIAGVGGMEQQRRSQETDMDIGRREKGEYDANSIAAQGLLEGVASPLAGGFLNLGGTLAKESIKGVGKITGINDSQFVRNTENFLSKWFAPSSGLDEISRRNVELGDSEFKIIRQKAEDLSENIDSIFKRDFKEKSQSDIDLINKAMEKEEGAIDALRERSPDMANLMEDFDKLRLDTYKLVRAKDLQVSSKVQKIFRRSNKYTRDIYEMSQKAREPLEKFLERPENENLLNEFKMLAYKADTEDQIEFGKKLGLRDEETGELKPFADFDSKRTFNPKKVDTMLEQQFKILYTPSSVRDSKYGALKSKKDLPEVLRRIYGLNLNPAMRATQTIAGIVEPISDLRIAGNLAESLLSRGLAVFKEGRYGINEASADLGEDAVPLITSKSFKDQKNEAFRESPFTIRGDVFDPKLGNVYVSKSLAEKLKVMTDRTNVFSQSEQISPLVQAFAATQGYMKKGKTVYSPVAHIRNFLGAMQNVANSGNWVGIGKYVKDIAPLPKTSIEKQDFFNKMKRLGVEGTNVELNQILNRLSDLEGISEDNLQGVSGWAARNFVRANSLFISSAEKTRTGRKISRTLEKLYTKTDDLGKMMAFFGERINAKKMFDEMTPIQKEEFRNNFITNFGKRIPQEKLAKIQVTKTGLPSKVQQRFRKQYEKDLKDFDDAMLDEFATEKALNVMPVYSRIPKVLEKMRGIPVIGSFTAFPAENLRNKYNVLKLGSQEIRDGFALGNNSLVKQGANRLFSQGAIASAPVIAAYTYNEINGTDKVMDFVRESFPEWSRYHALQIREKKNKDGEIEYGVTDLSYNNPDQFVLDIIGPMMVTAANGEDVTENLDTLFLDVIKGTAEPFVDKSLALQYATEMLGYIRTNNPEVAATKLARAYKIAEPGLIKNLREMAGDLGAYQSIDKLYQKVGDATPGSYIQSKIEPLYYGDNRKYLKDSSSLAAYLQETAILPNSFMLPYNLAAKETVLNPTRQLGFAVKGLMGNANSNFNINSKAMKDRMRDTKSNFTFKGVLELYQSGIEDQFVAQQGVYKLIQDLRKFTKDSDIRKMLSKKEIKQAGGLSNEEINNLMRGKFTPPTFDESFFKQLRKDRPELRKITPTLNAKIKQLRRFYVNEDLKEKEVPVINIGD